MERAFWIKQQAGKPHSDDLLWSRPENKLYAGKLLIIGGNLHGFTAPAEAFQQAQQAGAGTLRVLLPDAVQKLIGRFMDAAEYAPSTPSGSFSQKALLEWIESAHWSDLTLLTGDLGRNSETAIVFEKFLEKSNTPLVITKDAVNYALGLPQKVLQRPNTTLVLSMAQLQKLAIAASWPQAITFNMDLLRLVDALHDFSRAHLVQLIVKQHDTIIAAVNGQIGTTLLSAEMPVWRVTTAAHAAVWIMQNPQKQFEAMMTAISELNK